MDVHLIVETGLALLTLVFGGCNILQLRNNAALRRKMEAEADHTRYDAQQVVIEGLQAEIQRLQIRVADGDERYAKLDARYTELLEVTIELRNKIAKLETT